MTSLQQTAMGGGSATAKTASYTLVAADAGTTVIMNSASATTITVNTSLFSAGDTVFIQNIGAGISTITAGTATVNTASSLALAQYESGYLYFTAAGASIFSKADGAAAAGGGLTLLSTTTLSGSTTTISGISGAYKNLQIIMRNPTWATGVAKIRLAIDGTITFKTSGVISWASGANKDTMVFYSTVQNPMQDTSSNTDGTNSLVWNIYDYAQTTAFKPIDIAWSNATQAYIAGGCIATNGAVSQIQIINDQSYAFNGGSVLIYGVN